MSGEIFPEHEKVLSRLIEENGIKEYRLPSLVQEKGWLSDLWESILKTLNQWFPGSEYSVNLSQTVEVLKVFLMIGVALALLVLIYHFFRKYYKGAGFSALRRHKDENILADYQNNESYMIANMLKSLNDREYARAARLRWKLFLERCQTPDWTTPCEYLNMAKENPGIFGSGPQVAIWPDRLNILMFGGPFQDSRDYEMLDKTLSDAEKTQ